MMTLTLHIHLLGDFHLAYGDMPVTTVNTSRLQSLLAYLVLHRDAPQPRQHLAFLLWPDSTEAQARTNLRHQFHLLRQALPEADRFLSADAQNLQWRLDAPFIFDVADFKSGVTQATSVTALRKAVELYQGDLLLSCYDDWILPERERLRQMFVEALERLIGFLESERDYPTAIRYAQRLLHYDPLSEATYRHLMRLYALNGDQTSVQRTYQECTTILQHELAAEPSPATRQAYERLVNLDLPLLAQRQNLPTQLTPFIGREEELSKIAQFLANPACRLLTIVGPGGIGKTRLALEAASQQIGIYWHGVYFVSLAAITSADYLVSAIGDALNFSFHGAEAPKVQLLSYLREKELLLVLDNFEHLLTPTLEEEQRGVQLLLELLIRAPGVKLLLTSRERLSLTGEWLLEISGLSVPPLSGMENEGELESYSASALFLQTAQRTQPKFSLVSEKKSEVVRLCRLVEGMPLALELAASWVRLLSCGEIVREIEQSLGFLTTSLRDVSERHRSMQAVFDHSWQLLSSEEKKALRQLSIFQGGFRREAAEQVAGASLSILSSLVDKSLLRRNSLGGYDMHELLRQYALARLQETSEEKEAVEDRHSSYYMGYLWRQTERLTGGQQSQAVAEMKPDVDNIRLAWDWAVMHGKFKEIRRVVPGWSNFYDILGWYHEFELVCRQTVEILEKEWSDGAVKGHRSEAEEREQGIVLGQMLAARGGTFLRLGLFSQSKDLLQQSLARLRSLEAQAELAVALFYYGSLAISLGEFTEAQALLQEGLAINQELEDHRGIALCLGALGLVAHSLGENERAAQLMQQSVELMRAVGDQHFLALYLGMLSGVVSALGELPAAKRLLQESLIISRALGDRWIAAFNLNQLGLVTYLMGEAEWAEAKRLYQEGLAISTELGDRWNIAFSLNHLGQISYALGELQEAKQYFLTALKTAMEAQAASIVLDALVGLVIFLIKEQSNIAAPEFVVKEQALEWLALVLNHPASRKETRDRANALVSELAAELPVQVITAARERGQDRKLEEVVAEILAEKSEG